MEDDSSISIRSSGNVIDAYENWPGYDLYEKMSAMHPRWRAKSQKEKKRMLEELYSIISLRENGNHELPAPIRMAIDHALGPYVESIMHRISEEIKEGIFNRRLLSTDRVSVQQVETMVRLFPDVIDGDTRNMDGFCFSITGALRGEMHDGHVSKRRAIKSIPFVPALARRWELLTTDSSDNMNALQVLSDCTPIIKWDDEVDMWFEDQDEIDNDDYKDDRDYNTENDDVKLEALKKLHQSDLFRRSDIRKYDLIHFMCKEDSRLLETTKRCLMESNDVLYNQYLEFFEDDDEQEEGTLTEDDFWKLHESTFEEEYAKNTKIAVECFSKRRFKYLVDFDSTSLGSKSNSKEFNGRVPLHLCVHSKKIFNTVFEEGMNRYPHYFGFLFHKDDSNTTPYELACNTWGTHTIHNRMWKKLNIARKKLELDELADEEEDVGDEDEGKPETTVHRKSSLSTEILIVSAAANPDVSLDCVYLLFRRDPSIATHVTTKRQRTKKPTRHDAINYLTKIKKRFADEPEKILKFREITHTLNNGKRGIAHLRTVLDEVFVLLAEHPDLLKEFTTVWLRESAVQSEAKKRLEIVMKEAAMKTKQKKTISATVTRKRKLMSTTTTMDTNTTTKSAKSTSTMPMQGNTAKKSAASPKKSKPTTMVKAAAEEEAVYAMMVGDDMMEEDHEEVVCNIPGVNADQIREKVGHIVSTADISTLTVKQVRVFLEDWFDIDLTQHKDYVYSVTIEFLHIYHERTQRRMTMKQARVFLEKKRKKRRKVANR